MPILDAHALDSDPEGCAFLRSVLRDDWNRASDRAEPAGFTVKASEPPQRVSAPTDCRETEPSEMLAPA